MLFVCKWKRSGFKCVIVVTWSHHHSSLHRYKIQVTQIRASDRYTERDRERELSVAWHWTWTVGQQDDRSSHRGSTLSNTADHSFICSHIFANRRALNLGFTHACAASAQITNSNWVLIIFWPRNEERQQHFSSLTKPSGQAKRGRATSKIVKQKNVNKLHEICKFRWWTWKKTRQRLHNCV